MTKPSVGSGRQASAPIGIGGSVRLRKSGRAGVVKAIVDPPRAGRSLVVVWEGGIDYSLVSPDEIELGVATEGVATSGSSVHFVDGDSGD